MIIRIVKRSALVRKAKGTVRDTWFAVQKYDRKQPGWVSINATATLTEARDFCRHIGANNVDYVGEVFSA